MQITKRLDCKISLYSLILSKEDEEELSIGCLRKESISEISEDGITFYLFPSNQGIVSDSFLAMPDDMGYFMNLGKCWVSELPRNHSHSELLRRTMEAYKEIEEAIRSLREIPIKTKDLSILGYATLRVKE